MRTFGLVLIRVVSAMVGARLVPMFRVVFLSLSLAAMMTACFKGAEREKKPPPGIPGGQCEAPDGQCDEGVCNRDRNYCYQPADPCLGFFCGGSERGICLVTQEGLPSCMCGPGFQNETFELYCCPEGNIGDVDCEQAAQR